MHPRIIHDMRAAANRAGRRVFVTALLIFAAHADAALASLSETLGRLVESLRGPNTPYEVPREDRAEFRKSLAALRAARASPGGEEEARAHAARRRRAPLPLKAFDINA